MDQQWWLAQLLHHHHHQTTISQPRYAEVSVVPSSASAIQPSSFGVHQRYQPGIRSVPSPTFLSNQLSTRLMASPPPLAAHTLDSYLHALLPPSLPRPRPTRTLRSQASPTLTTSLHDASQESLFIKKREGRSRPTTTREESRIKQRPPTTTSSSTLVKKTSTRSSSSSSSSGIPVKRESLKKDLRGALNVNLESKRCSSCSTRSSCQWRSGPAGNLLCNACGLRYRRGQMVFSFETLDEHGQDLLLLGEVRPKLLHEQEGADEPSSCSSPPSSACPSPAPTPSTPVIRRSTIYDILN